MGNRVDKYKPLVLLGVFAVVSELGYAVVNISAMPMFVEFELGMGHLLGVVFLAYLLAEALFRAPLGVLSDRWGRKPFLVGAPIVSIFTALATVRVNHILPLFGLRILDGAAAAAIWTTAYAAMGDATSEKRRATAMSVINVSYMSGLALGPLAGGIVDDLSNGRMRPFAASFYLAASLFFIAAAFAYFLYPKSDPAPRIIESRRSDKRRFDAFLYTARLMPEMLMIVVATFLAIGFLVPIAKLFAVQELHMTETRFGGLLAPGAAILGLLAVPLGHLADRWGRTRSVGLGLGIAACAMWLLARETNLFAVGAEVAALGVGFALGMPAWLAIVSERGEESRRGEVIGTAGMLQSMATVVGVIVGNHLYHSRRWQVGAVALSAHRLPFAGSAILLTISLALCIAFVRDRRKE